MKISLRKINANGKSILVPINFDNETNNTNNIFSFGNFKDEGIVKPQVFISTENVEEDYDYNYDDELEYQGLITNTNYYPVDFNPFSGEKFDFEIIEEIDLSKELNILSSRFEEISSKRQSRKRQNAMMDILRESMKLIEPYKSSMIGVFEKNEDNFYSEQDIENIDSIIFDGIF